MASWESKIINRCDSLRNGYMLDPAVVFKCIHSNCQNTDAIYFGGNHYIWIQTIISNNLESFAIAGIVKKRFVMEIRKGGVDCIHILKTLNQFRKMIFWEWFNSSCDKQFVVVKRWQQGKKASSSISASFIIEKAVLPPMLTLIHEKQLSTLFRSFINSISCNTAVLLSELGLR